MIQKRALLSSLLTKPLSLSLLSSYLLISSTDRVYAIGEAQQQDLQMDFQLTASASICDERTTSFHRIFNYAPVTFFHFDLLRSVPKAKK